MNRAKRINSFSMSKCKVLTVPSAPDEPLVLRRSKRNRKGDYKNDEQRLETLNERQKCQSPVMNDSSDCIVLNEIIVTDSDPSKNRSPGKILTSTPVKNFHSKGTKVNEKALEAGTCVGFSNSSNDVIIISDTSLSSLQVIEISDDEVNECDVDVKAKVKVNGDVEVLCSTEDHECRNKKLKLQEPNENVIVNNPVHREKYPFPNMVPKSRKRNKDFYRKKRKILKDKLTHMNNRSNVNKDIKKFDVGGNVYMENPIILPNIGLRPIIIDGSNVAFHHSNNSHFSCKGLEICINYFKQRGHHVTAFVPQFRMQNNKSDNPKLLDSLVRRGDVILTPSRRVDGNPIVSYDDRYIVQIAALKGGVIVTRDNYRDLLAENPAWSETIKYRLLQFTWVEDLLIFPKDPLGQNGPTLEEFLRFG